VNGAARQFQVTGRHRQPFRRVMRLPNSGA
jgi:hypothetical protein